ncbi:MAG: hypothetical protein IKZ43_05605 [Acidaminococcaceae bacterium]|nr:hypothetical protein [Acidaminococcaceae bacterium]
MFFNRNYIPAVPIREEQRLSEEEELARQLKREARIFFPDKKLPDFDNEDLPPLTDERQKPNEKPSPGLPSEQKSRSSERAEGRQSSEPRDISPDREERTTVLKDHDAVCREEDSMWRKTDGSFSHHEVEAARQEAQQIARNRQQLKDRAQSKTHSAEGEIGLQTGAERVPVQPRLNKQDLKRGIRLKVILDKPRGLTPWKGDKF